MDDVNCAGSETYLMECGFPGTDRENCGHGEDAGVTCSGRVMFQIIIVDTVYVFDLMLMERMEQLHLVQHK